MPFVFITGNATVNPAYVVPEFYDYQVFTNDSWTGKFYSAVPCIDYYTALYGSWDNFPLTL